MELQTIILLFQAKAKMWPRWNWRKVVLGVCWVATRRPVGSQPSTRRSIFLVQTINLLVARQGNNAEMRTWTSRKCMFHSESGNLCCDVDSQLKCQFVLGGLIRRLNHEDPWRFRWTSFYWDTWRFCGMNLARKSTKYTLVFDMSVVIYIHTVPYISTYVNLMKQFQQYIYIYTRSRSARKKRHPVFFPLHFHRTLGGRFYLCPPRWCNMRTSRSLCCPPYSLMSWTSGSPTGVKHPCENLSLGWGKHHVCGETTTGV